jgi:hypothetical protein
LKSFTSHCPSIFPYNFSKGNPDFRVVPVVRGTVPLAIFIQSVKVPLSWRQFLLSGDDSGYNPCPYCHRNHPP